MCICSCARPLRHICARQAPVTGRLWAAAYSAEQHELRATWTTQKWAPCHAINQSHLCIERWTKRPPAERATTIFLLLIINNNNNNNNNNNKQRGGKVQRVRSQGLVIEKMLWNANEIVLTAGRMARVITRHKKEIQLPERSWRENACEKWLLDGWWHQTSLWHHSYRRGKKRG